MIRHVASAIAIMLLCGCAPWPPSEPLPPARIVGAAYPAWVGWCVTEGRDICPMGVSVPAAAVTLTADIWAMLERATRDVNRSVAYATDMQLYKAFERWTVAETRGDCEDYALAKMRRLLALGVPRGAVFIVVGTVGGLGHAELAVSTDRGVYLLSNRNGWVTPWRDSDMSISAFERPGSWEWGYYGEGL